MYKSYIYPLPSLTLPVSISVCLAVVCLSICLSGFQSVCLDLLLSICFSFSLFLPLLQLHFTHPLSSPILSSPAFLPASPYQPPPFSLSFSPDLSPSLPLPHATCPGSDWCVGGRPCNILAWLPTFREPTFVHRIVPR